MANPEHLEVLKKGVKVWNEWREQTSEVPDLSNKYLLSRDLEGLNLRDTNLNMAIFMGSRLSRADLGCANLFGANFTEAWVDGANFDGAIMGLTTFGDNDLSKAIGLETVHHRRPSTIGIDTIYKSRGRISEVFLRGCGVPDDFISYTRSLVNAGKVIQFYSCFISYSSKNQDFAERLYADLQNNGVRCWFAPEDLRIGAEIRIGIDESILSHDKLLLVLSEISVTSQWVQQEVETALAKEREQGRTVLFPIRLDDAVMQVGAGWPAFLKNTRNIGDFTGWKNHDSYRKAFDRLLRDLKAEVTNEPAYTTPSSLESRAVFSPRNTIIEEWDEVEALIVQTAKRSGLVSEGELVDCSRLINKLYEMGKVNKANRKKYFELSKWHFNVALNEFLPVEPGMAITFVSEAKDLKKAFE